MGLFQDCLYISCVAMFQIMYITFFGILFKRLKLVDSQFENSFSKFCANLMLPSFIFCEVIKSFDINNSKLILEIIIGSLIVSIIGILLGFLYSVIFGTGSNERNFFIGVLSSPNSTSLPLVIMEVISPLLDTIPYSPESNDPAIIIPSSKDRGMLYISLISICSNIWRWAAVYNLINPEEEKNDLEERLLLKENKNKSKSQSTSEIFLGIINAPIIVSIITLLLCISPSIQKMFTDQNSVLRETVFNVHLLISKGYSSSVIFLLGLNLANLDIFKDESEKQFTNSFHFEYSYLKLSVLVFFKLIVTPLLGTPIILLCQYYGFIKDSVLIFLFLFMLAAPTAINIIIICNLKKTRVNIISFFMLLTYSAALFTVTFLISLFLYLLKN